MAELTTQEPWVKAAELMPLFEWKPDLCIECVKKIISACEYNNVEHWNTDWWNKVIDELNKLSCPA